ncbi:hypothetical protein KM043_007009 [Ampulex compressa]|nr:hypothetical protein KM043_007009 [Ampulex compressa]
MPLQLGLEPKATKPVESQPVAEVKQPETTGVNSNIEDRNLNANIGSPSNCTDNYTEHGAASTPPPRSQAPNYNIINADIEGAGEFSSMDSINEPSSWLIHFRKYRQIQRRELKYKREGEQERVFQKNSVQSTPYFPLTVRHPPALLQNVGNQFFALENAVGLNFGAKANVSHNTNQNVQKHASLLGNNVQLPAFHPSSTLGQSGHVAQNVPQGPSDVVAQNLARNANLNMNYNANYNRNLNRQQKPVAMGISSDFSLSMLPPDLRRYSGQWNVEKSSNVEAI